MREILFKGFHPDENGKTEITVNNKKIKGDWIESKNVFYSDDGKVEMLYGYTNYRIAYDIVPETVCEYIGLIDKKGKKIFEGDLVNDEDFDYCPCEIVFDKYRGAYWGHEIGESDDSGYHGLSDCEWVLCGNKFEI